MKFTTKILLSIGATFIVSGCSLPGTSLSLSDKNVVNKKVEKEESKAAETINVYSLSSEFIAQYNKNALLQNNARINAALDEQLSAYEYKVGTGDILNITIWDHPELTIPAGSYRSAQEAGHWVHADGQIFYPYIGFVSVKDKTVNEIRDNIAARLVKYVESPQVDVNLAAFRSQKMYVTGEINKPGKQAITNVPLTLLDAINQAGGITTDADWRNVSVTRDGKTEVISLHNLMQHGDLTENRLMKAGDIIHVPRNDAQKVFVLGEVKSPKLLKIDRAGMTLTEALTSVGGINELSADATGIFVVRSTARDTENEALLASIKANQHTGETSESEVVNVANIYQLDISDAAALMIGTEFKLTAYDVVYVTTSPMGMWNRVITQFLPTITAFNSLTEGAVRVKNW